MEWMVGAIYKLELCSSANHLKQRHSEITPDDIFWLINFSERRLIHVISAKKIIKIPSSLLLMQNNSIIYLDCSADRWSRAWQTTLLFKRSATSLSHDLSNVQMTVPLF